MRALAKVQPRLMQRGRHIFAQRFRFPKMAGPSFGISADFPNWKSTWEAVVEFGPYSHYRPYGHHVLANLNVYFTNPRLRIARK